LSLVLFIGALIAAIGDRASEVSQLREASHSDPTFVRRFVGNGVHAHTNVPRPALATRPATRSSPHRS
jgi:hypothetical protein